MSSPSSGSLQVMLGGRAGSTLVGLLTVDRGVFEELGEIGLPTDVQERLVSWRARFGLVIDNALNFLNNPDGIQGHNFGTQLSHGEAGLTLQGRLTLVRYNNEPQFFIADADVLLSVAADMLERLGEHLEPEMIDPELVVRLREGVDLVERQTKPRSRGGAAAARHPGRLGRVTGARRVFLAATGQNRGKTTASLGLLAAIRDRGLRLGFIKPVGQRYLVVDGTRADEDAVLVAELFDLPDPLDDMSPVTLPRHFTTDCVMGRVDEDLPARITAASERVAANRDVIVIEGTGHAGVGAVVGVSNAAVAALLDAPVIIVSEGGVGRPIDEIVLNGALFAAHGARVLGALVNKVDVESHPDLPEILARGLGQHGIDLLGCIPYSALLANPSLELIATHLEGELLAGYATPGQTIGWIAIGAMQATHAVELPPRPDAAHHPGRPRGPHRRGAGGEPHHRATDADHRPGPDRRLPPERGGHRGTATGRRVHLPRRHRHLPHGAGGRRDPGEDASIGRREDRDDHRPGGWRASTSRGCSRASERREGRPDVGTRRPPRHRWRIAAAWAAGASVTARIIGMADAAALVLWAVARARPGPNQATCCRSAGSARSTPPRVRAPGPRRAGARPAFPRRPR